MNRTWPDVLGEHLATVGGLRDAAPVLDNISETILQAIRGGGKVLVCGNGGSAADALHIAGELVGRFRANRCALPAIALSADVCTLTAVANDFGYEHVFARQVEALGQSGDVLWALSTSGNSRNVLAALQAARARGLATIGFSGESGGQMSPLCDLLFCAPHISSDRIQECHVLAYHYVCERVEAAFQHGREKPPAN